MTRISLTLLAAWLSVGTALAQDVRFAVRHDHAIGSCAGELIFGPESVSYQASYPEHTRTWNYEDIQQIALLGPESLTILTYEDSKWTFGKDRRYRFRIKDGAITPALWAMLQGKVARPLVSAVFPQDISGRYRIPVKHHQAFSGTQGDLEIGEEYITYRTAKEQDSRIWRYEDISSVGSTGPYQFRITTFERTGGESGGERNFVFTLKRRLAPEIYDFVWWKINGPKIAPGEKR